MHSELKMLKTNSYFIVPFLSFQSASMSARYYLSIVWRIKNLLRKLIALFQNPTIQRSVAEIRVIGARMSGELLSTARNM